MMTACFPNPYICRRIISSLPISLDWKIPQQDKGGSHSNCFMLSFRLGREEGKFRSALWYFPETKQDIFLWHRGGSSCVMFVLQTEAVSLMKSSQCYYLEGVTF